MYKNWKAICEVKDNHMMWALALLDLTSDLGRRFVEQLPEFFSQEETAGPYPLSLMREAAQENGRKQGTDNGANYIVSHDGVPGHIPVKMFDKFGKNVASLNGPKLPDEISPDARAGETVTWEGKQFVVLENNDSCEELAIAPAELIFVD